MITVKNSVLEILQGDYVAIQSMSRGLMNLSKYARTIQETVSNKAKKKVGIQSIVVALSRLEKEIHIEAQKNVVIEQLSVQSPITHLVYPKSDENTEILSRILEETRQDQHTFFSFSVSTKDIAILISDLNTEAIIKSFEKTPTVKKSMLSAISVRFPEKGVSEANVGLVILSKLAAKNIPLDAALTTYNEFTLVLESKNLQKAMESLT